MKRAVLYARVSSDDSHKDGRNLAGQLDMGRKYSLDHGYSVVAELAEDDRGASGAAFELPQLNRMREMARNHEFDVLVVREIDRLSRKLAKQLIVEGDLKRYGVRIEYVLGEYPDNPEGNLMKHVRASVAEYEREKINERMTRGRRLKVKNGSVMLHGHAPYGYRQIEENGKFKLAIEEAEARIVRFMYSWYAIGDGENGPLSLEKIKQRLEAMNVPTTHDVAEPWMSKQRGFGKWSRTGVSRMLRNETYAGVWRYSKRAKDLTDELAVGVPAIVDRQLWEAVQERMAYNKSKVRKEPKYEHLMRLRMECGDCHAAMVSVYHPGKGTPYLYYRCHGAKNNARPCHNTLTFPSSLADAYIWEWVKDILADRDRLAVGLANYQNEREHKNAPILERITSIDELLQDYRAQLGRLVEMAARGIFTEEEILTNKVRLRQIVQGLEKERAEQETKLGADSFTDEQIKTLMDFAERMSEGLAEAEEDFTARRHLIELLNVRGELWVEDGVKMLRASARLGTPKAWCIMTLCSRT